MNNGKQRLLKLFFTHGCSTAACILLALSSVAQTDTTRALKEVKLKTDAVPAVKTIVPAQQISAADFKRYGAYTAADAIRNFSGINIKDYGGIGGLKTVSVRSLGAGYTAVQYDGLSIGDAQNGQIDLGRINLDNIAAITLYNGQPGEIAVPARSFASGSVLVIQSLKPSLTAVKPYQVNLGLNTGSFGLFNPAAQWQQRLGDRWSFNLSGSVQNADGRYKYKVEGDGSDTLATRSNTRVKTALTDFFLFYTAKDSSRLNLRANFSNSDRDLPGAVVFYNPLSRQKLRDRSYFIQSGYEKKRKTVQLLLNARLSNTYTRYTDPDYLNSAGFLELDYTQQEAYGSAVIAGRLTQHLGIAYASDLVLSTLTGSQYLAGHPRRLTALNALSSGFSLGGIKLQGTLLHTLIHEHAGAATTAANRSAWSPTLSASYRASDTGAIMIRAFYKNTFRSPTFNDLYYTQLGTRQLRPEYASQYNLGLTLTTFPGNAKYLTFSADLYYNRLRDKIISVPGKNLFTWSTVNLGRVAIWGADTGLKLQVPLGADLQASFSGNYTYQQAVDVTNKGSALYLNQIPYTPEHALAVNTGLSHSGWGIFYNQVYSSHRYYLGENLPVYRLPGFLVGDLSLNRRFGRWRFPVSASAEINNLFNTSYAVIRSFPMPGRSFRFSFQIII